MAEENKLNMFGKSYNTTGTNQANLCLYTLGEVKVKTPTKFFTVFKDGKLITDTNILKSVSSVDDIHVDGIFLVNGEEGSSQVYARIDGNLIKIADESSAALSYTVQQSLTSEQIQTACLNIGLVFQTLAAAKEKQIQNGFVYIIEENAIYIIKDGEFKILIESTESTESTENTEQEDSETEEEEKALETLTIGSLFLDGINSVITSKSLALDTSLILRNAVQYDSTYTSASNGFVKGQKGYSLYNENGVYTLEVDDIVIHNSSVLEERTLNTSNYGIIDTATILDSKTADLDFKNNTSFKKDDIVILQNSNLAETITVNVESDENGNLVTKIQPTGTNVSGAIKIIFIKNNDEEDADGNIIIKESTVEEVPYNFSFNESDTEEKSIGVFTKDGYEASSALLTSISASNYILEFNGLKDVSYKYYQGKMLTPKRLQLDDAILESVDLSNCYLYNLGTKDSHYIESTNGNIILHHVADGENYTPIVIGDLSKKVEKKKEGETNIGVYIASMQLDTAVFNDFAKYSTSIKYPTDLFTNNAYNKYLIDVYGLKQYSKTLEEKVAALQTQVNTLEGKVKNLEIEKDAMSATISNLKTSLSNLENRIKTLEGYHTATT